MATKLKQTDGERDEDPLIEVWVRRQFNDYQKAKYELNTIGGIHWDRVSGGVGAKAPQPLLYGYVWCNEMLEGELSHSGVHGPCPHQIKVCILRGDNDPEMYAQLKEEAGPKPQVTTCRQDAVRIVREHGEIHGPRLRELLRKAGHGEFNIGCVLPKMVRGGELAARREGHSFVYALPEKSCRVL